MEIVEKEEKEEEEEKEKRRRKSRRRRRRSLKGVPWNGDGTTNSFRTVQ